MPAQPDVMDTLRRFWGYDSFRPLQERVVQSLLAGRDDERLDKLNHYRLADR